MTVSTLDRLTGAHLDGIPLEMRRAPRWAMWRYEDRNGKPTKVPYSIVRMADARSDHPEDWTTFDLAAAYWVRKRKHDGLGFLLGDGWGGVDLDKCRHPETGAIEAWALEIIDHLKSYTEISPSGTGLKVFICGVTPGAGKRRKGFTSYDGGTRGEMEVYTQLRYFTVTGNRYDG